MRLSLMVVIGSYHVFGLGFNLVWMENEWTLEAQIGPFFIWAARGFGRPSIYVLGNQVFK